MCVWVWSVLACVHVCVSVMALRSVNVMSPNFVSMESKWSGLMSLAHGGSRVV